MIIQVLLCSVLLILAIQDFRLRAVHWLLFPILLILVVSDSLRNFNLREYISGTAINLMIIVIQGVILYVYYSLQGKTISHIVNRLIGTGDLIFIIIMAFAFSWTSFIFFYIAGLLFALIFWLIRLVVTRDRPGLIPLAGLLAVYMIILMIAGVFIPEISRNANLINNLMLYGN
jgi:hypothetical protein